MEKLKDHQILVRQIGQKYEVEDALILAIIWQESKGETWAFRFEPKFSYRYTPSVFAKNLGISLDTEIMAQMTSWGLMQVMGCVARECGFDSHLPKLLIPEIGLEYGVKKLSKLLKKYSTVQDVIAAYNGGSPIVINGQYRNQHYVDSVLSHLDEILKSGIL